MIRDQRKRHRTGRPSCTSSYWRAHIRDFRVRLRRGDAVIRLSPRGRERLGEVASDHLVGAVALAVARERPAGAAPVLAVDISAAMVAAGRVRVRRSGVTGAIDWRVAPAVPLPAADATLDVILCASSLHFLGTGALADWRGALRPGGRVGFTLPLASQFRPSGEFAALVAADLPLPDTAGAARVLARAAPASSTPVPASST